jgi:hypothetical protein
VMVVVKSKRDQVAHAARWALWVKDKETETVVPAMDWSRLYTSTLCWSCDLITKTLPKAETIRGP